MAKGTYTTSTITVDGDGRVIAAASGSGGGTSGTITQYNSPGTHTSSNNSVWMMVAIAGAGGGCQPGTPAAGNGNATNFGTHLSAPGGNYGNGITTGTTGPTSNNLYWAVGQGQGGTQTTSGQIGAGNQGGALFGAGSGGTAQYPERRGAGSGGVTASILTEPQYTAGDGITVTTGTGGSGQRTGGSGRVVVIEYAT